MMRSSHHGSARISRTQASEMFQSSWTSWSSKIIVLGTVASSQRMSGSLHDSRYRRVYSSKSATCVARRLRDVAPGADERERLGRDLVGVDLVAEQQQAVGPRLAAPLQAPARTPTARRRRRPRGSSDGESVYGGSSGAPTRHEPNTSRA